MTEAEKSANNWAGSLNKVRNSWAELVNQFINSDNAISVLQSADKIIQNLSDSATTGSLKVLSDSLASLIKLISELTDKFGTLPTLLAGVMAFKGKSLFGGNLNQIVTDFKGISVEIDKYNHSVNRANYGQNLFKKGLENTNVDLRGYLSGLNGAQASVKGYVSSLVTARLKTIALNVATAALNATITFGLSLAISAIVKAFDDWVHAEEKAIESAKELRESGHDAIMELTKESESFEELQKQYIQLYSSTRDINEIKSELSKIQDELIDKYGKEADGIDLVNGNLSEQLEKMRELKREQSEAFIFNTENKKRYEQAKKSLEGTNENARIADSDATQFFRTTVSANSTKELSNLLRTFSESGVRYDQIVTDMWGKEASIAVMGDLKSQVEGWQKLADIYKQIDGYNKDVYDSLMQQYVLAKEKYDIDKADVDEFERQTKYYNSFDIPQNVLDNYNNLINKAGELKSIISGDYTDTEKLNAELELEDVHKELDNISKDYVVLKDDVDVVFNTINTGSQSSIKSIEDLRSAWFESLDDIQKNTISNIDKMDKAIKTAIDGGKLSSSDFWELAELDTDDIIKNIKLVNGEYQLSEKELIRLKDEYIQKQIESLKPRQRDIESKKEAQRQDLILAQQELDTIEKYNSARYGSANLNNPKYREYTKQLEDANNKVDTIKNNIKELGDEHARNNILIREYNSRLGYSAEQASALAEAYHQNFVKAIDDAIDKVNDRKQALEDEKDVLNDEKDILNEQLELLEEQQKAIEEQIENYKTVVGVIEEEIKKQTDALKEQQEAEEEIIQAKIDALKEEREQKEAEEDILEKELAVQEKLRDLEKAKNTKVRTFSSARGWHYDVDKEAVANAQSALTEAQKTYNEALEKREYENKIKLLEEEKKTVSKSYEERIKEYEDYTAEWKNILEEQSNAEEERLADEILGVKWREDIKHKDVNILNSFKTTFNQYNTQLNNLVNGEIATLKKSIKAKEDQIAAVDAQIEALSKEVDAWNKYKQDVEGAVDEINNKYSNLDGTLATTANNTSLSLDNMEIRLWNFKEHYKSYMDEAIDKANEFAAAASQEVDTGWMEDITGKVYITLQQWQDTLEELSKYNLHINSNGDAELHKRGSYANGGVVDYTGVANVHGTPIKSEVAFNSAQAKQLYNMVRTGSFENLVASKAIEGFRLANVATSNNNNNSTSVNIQNMNINGVQNPTQFAKEFNRNMEQYLQNEMIKSRVR